MMAQQAASTAIVLRAAAVWGTSVLAVRSLNAGQSFLVGDQPLAAMPKPDGSGVADSPVRAVGGGWEIDARGATGGVVFLRGRRENPMNLGHSGAPVPIVAGDYGLIQYGTFAVFFQFTQAPPALGTRRRVDWGLLLAFVFATIAVCGGLALFWAITTPPAIDKPIELTSQQDLLAKFNVKTEEEEAPPVAGKEKEEDKGKKDVGAKDKKEMGGGKKIQGKEGALGKNDKADKTELPGEIKPALGGMAEALSSEVGEEVKKTLGTISSVADALGGLRSEDIVLGKGSGTGLKGTGPAGGGTEPGGVPFGAGTLDTGWGPGRGGGYGTGSGGPGGPGRGGLGKGGSGDGGEGTGERKVAGKDAPKPGQGLSPAQISRVVMSRYGAFRACYESAASSNPTLKGNVGVSWTVTPGGSVSGASIGGSSLGNPRVEGCILRQFNRLKFPTADKPTGANWTFSFRPSKN
jgi:hypothetical protein